MKCPECGFESPENLQFCGSYGATLSEAGSRHETKASLEQQFGLMQEHLPSSMKDKLAIHADGENRIVTVLFADMSSSVEATRDLHPEDAANLVRRLLKTMIDVLSKHECRIDNIVGDEVVVVFGTPQAHESDPERAVLAALEIREQAQGLGLNVSVGINTGAVYFGGMGSVVNLASRLQGAAGAGEVLIGGSTYRQTRRSFELEPATLEIKGFEGPLTAYKVIKVLPRLEKARSIEGLRSELIGRDEELLKLTDAYGEAA